MKTELTRGKLYRLKLSGPEPHRLSFWAESTLERCIGEIQSGAPVIYLDLIENGIWGVLAHLIHGDRVGWVLLGRKDSIEKYFTRVVK